MAMMIISKFSKFNVHDNQLEKAGFLLGLVANYLYYM